MSLPSFSGKGPSTYTVKQQIFVCRKISWISRIRENHEIFLHANISCWKAQKLLSSKFAKFSCHEIAYGPNSRNFHVANISCYTVLWRRSWQAGCLAGILALSGKFVRVCTENLVNHPGLSRIPQPDGSHDTDKWTQVQGLAMVHRTSTRQWCKLEHAWPGLTHYVGLCCYH